jgi:hypothetical protein
MRRPPIRSRRAKAARLSADLDGRVAVCEIPGAGFEERGLPLIIENR